MNKNVIILIVFVLIGLSSQSQNTNNPWLIGVSTNYVDFHAIEQSIGDQFSDADWMGKTIPGMLRIGRNINKSFNASALFATVQTEPLKMNLIPLERTINTDKFYKFGVQLEYKLANDYLLKESSWFDPYLFLGMNGSAIDELTYLSSSMGLGFNIWFIEPLGVNFQGAYDYNWDFNDYMHYSIGLVYRVGKKKDMDGDGISDKKDLCPEIAGLLEFQGCPDTDGDGIQDKDDECPRAAGSAELNGCPDTDSDGIADKIDECPNVAGLAEFNGCPDSDGDGITDKNDECPNIAGLAEFNGCPDSDGDGVPDNRDNCPEEFGTKNNRGCPAPVIVPVEEIKEIEEKLNFNAEQIQFKSSSAELTPESFTSLKNVLDIMNKYAETKFTIYGYTDNTGPDDFNLTLSKDRANAVKDYFTGNGIDARRLESGGFGEKNPIAPNDSKEGRLKNRRVEIKLIK
ncbi:MAG: OmpA family protein [Bacteroidales bacterium]|nr:OmpA family protein [Bacteroidales bacterium]